MDIAADKLAEEVNHLKNRLQTAEDTLGKIHMLLWRNSNNELTEHECRIAIARALRDDILSENKGVQNVR
jgi:hypothetical protein